MSLSYKRIRGWFLSGVAIIILSAGSFMIYREFFTPPPLPSIPIDITVNAPERSSPPSTATQQAYTVPSASPRRLIISSIGVDALILPMDVLPSGALDAPKTAWDAGWYSGGGLPGKTGAPTILDGHVNDAFNTPGIFHKLHTLQESETITIERGDMSTIDYVVQRVSQLPMETINMKTLLQPQNNKRLVLITCGGTYDRAKQTFSDRVIVEAISTDS